MIKRMRGSSDKYTPEDVLIAGGHVLRFTNVKTGVITKNNMRNEGDI